MARSDLAWQEDLVAQATAAQAIGRVSCTCSDHYHLFWAALRAASITAPVGVDEGALAEALADSPSGARILIGGSADTGTLCAVLRVMAGRSPHLTVLDRCAAPLALIDAYVATRGLAVKTRHADLLRLPADEAWDVVVLNYTHHFIAADMREAFFRSLAGVLAPGGVLVCLARELKPRDDAKDDDWLEQARRSLAGLPDLAWRADEMGAMLMRYATSRSQRRQNAPDTLRVCDALSQAGLAVFRTPETNLRLNGVSTARPPEARSAIWARKPQ